MRRFLLTYRSSSLPLKSLRACSTAATQDSAGRSTFEDVVLPSLPLEGITTVENIDQSVDWGLWYEPSAGALKSFLSQHGANDIIMHTMDDKRTLVARRSEKNAPVVKLLEHFTSLPSKKEPLSLVEFAEKQQLDVTKLKEMIASHCANLFKVEGETVVLKTSQTTAASTPDPSTPNSDQNKSKKKKRNRNKNKDNSKSAVATETTDTQTTTTEGSAASFLKHVNKVITTHGVSMSVVLQETQEHIPKALSQEIVAATTDDGKCEVLLNAINAQGHFKAVRVLGAMCLFRVLEGPIQVTEILSLIDASANKQSVGVVEAKQALKCQDIDLIDVVRSFDSLLALENDNQHITLLPYASRLRGVAKGIMQKHTMTTPTSGLSDHLLMMPVSDFVASIRDVVKRSPLCRIAFPMNSLDPDLCHVSKWVVMHSNATLKADVAKIIKALDKNSGAAVSVESLVGTLSAETDCASVIVSLVKTHLAGVVSVENESTLQYTSQAQKKMNVVSPVQQGEVSPALVKLHNVSRLPGFHSKLKQNCSSQGTTLPILIAKLRVSFPEFDCLDRRNTKELVAVFRALIEGSKLSDVLLLIEPPGGLAPRIFRMEWKRLQSLVSQGPDLLTALGSRTEWVSLADLTTELRATGKFQSVGDLSSDCEYLSALLELSADRTKVRWRCVDEVRKRINERKAHSDSKATSFKEDIVKKSTIAAAPVVVVAPPAAVTTNNKPAEDGKSKFEVLIARVKEAISRDKANVKMELQRFVSLRPDGCSFVSVFFELKKIIGDACRFRHLTNGEFSLFFEAVFSAADINNIHIVMPPTNVFPKMFCVDADRTAPQPFDVLTALGSRTEWVTLADLTTELRETGKFQSVGDLSSDCESLSALLEFSGDTKVRWREKNRKKNNLQQQQQQQQQKDAPNNEKEHCERIHAVIKGAITQEGPARLFLRELRRCFHGNMSRAQCTDMSIDVSTFSESELNVAEKFLEYSEFMLLRSSPSPRIVHTRTAQGIVRSESMMFGIMNGPVMDAIMKFGSPDPEDGTVSIEMAKLKPHMGKLIQHFNIACETFLLFFVKTTLKDGCRIDLHNNKNTGQKIIVLRTKPKTIKKEKASNAIDKTLALEIERTVIDALRHRDQSDAPSISELTAQFGCSAQTIRDVMRQSRISPLINTTSTNIVLSVDLDQRLGFEGIRVGSLHMGASSITTQTLRSIEQAYKDIRGKEISLTIVTLSNVELDTLVVEQSAAKRIRSLLQTIPDSGDAVEIATVALNINETYEECLRMLKCMCFLEVNEHDQCVRRAVLPNGSWNQKTKLYKYFVDHVAPKLVDDSETDGPDHRKVLSDFGRQMRADCGVDHIGLDMKAFVAKCSRGPLTAGLVNALTMPGVVTHSKDDHQAATKRYNYLSCIRILLRGRFFVHRSDEDLLHDLAAPAVAACYHTVRVSSLEHVVIHKADGDEEHIGAVKKMFEAGTSWSRASLSQLELEAVERYSFLFRVDNDHVRTLILPGTRFGPRGFRDMLNSVEKVLPDSLPHISETTPSMGLTRERWGSLATFVDMYCPHHTTLTVGPEARSRVLVLRRHDADYVKSDLAALSAAMQHLGVRPLPDTIVANRWMLEFESEADYVQNVIVPIVAAAKDKTVPIPLLLRVNLTPDAPKKENDMVEFLKKFGGSRIAVLQKDGVWTVSINN